MQKQHLEFSLKKSIFLGGGVFAPPPKGMGVVGENFCEKESAHQYGSNKVLTLIIEGLFSA